MIPKNIEDITEKGLQELISNKVTEKKTLEYKEILPGSSDSEKIEFLADVSSFANTNGGDLVFGISEDRETGVPASLNGVEIKNPDEEKRRLDSIIRDSIKLRIPSIFIKEVLLSNKKYALIIRITKSWIGPHRVTYKGHDKFYGRSTNGKYPLDVTELKLAFTLSDTLSQKVRNFRLERISRIINEETPIPLFNRAKIVLHLIPLLSFGPIKNDYIIEISKQNEFIAPIYCSALWRRFNFDGYLTHSSLEDKLPSYTQFFRNGIIEAVDTALLEPQGEREDKLFIPSDAIEESLLESICKYFILLKKLGISPPIVISISLLGVKGYKLETAYRSNQLDFQIGHPIDRENLLIPEIIVENGGQTLSILKPIFDTIWNACGYSKSFRWEYRNKSSRYLLG